MRVFHNSFNRGKSRRRRISQALYCARCRSWILDPNHSRLQASRSASQRKLTARLPRTAPFLFAIFPGWQHFQESMRGAHPGAWTRTTRPNPRAVRILRLLAQNRYRVERQDVPCFNSVRATRRCACHLHATCFLDVGWGPCADSCNALRRVCTRMA